MKTILAISTALSACALASFTTSSHASCGAGFCTVNSNWDIHGVGTEPGLRLDLRYEYVDQDQPRAGRNKVAIGEVHRHHDEIETINRNLLATFDYSPNETWGVSAQLPLIDRSHSHIHNHHGKQIFDSWNLGGIGDLRVLGRYGLPHGAGLTAGLKLPTGSFDDTNADGQTAERSLQAGTGTTDLLAGFYRHQQTQIAGRPVTWFVQAQAQIPLNARADYRPGRQLFLDAGLDYPATGALNAMLQLNTHFKGRDGGAEAEAEDSGGTFVSVSPGFSYALDRNLRVYGFVQLPLYQHVNGVQLTASRSFAAGVNYRF